MRAGYKALSSRFGEHWWDRDDYKKAVRPLKHELFRETLADMAHHHDEVWLTAELDVVGQLLRDGELKSTEVKMWLPSVSTLHRNHLQRHKEGNKTQPVLDMATITQWRQHYLDEAKKLGLEVKVHIQ
jgi:hypothetical protein